jgi:hypothetical protein
MSSCHSAIKYFIHKSHRNVIFPRNASGLRCASTKTSEKYLPSDERSQPSILCLTQQTSIFRRCPINKFTTSLNRHICIKRLLPVSVNRTIAESTSAQPKTFGESFRTYCNVPSPLGRYLKFIIVAFGAATIITTSF